MADHRRPSLGMALLVGGVILVFLLAVASFVPLLRCPACDGRGEVYATRNREYVWLCSFCKGGRLSLLQRWIHSRKRPRVDVPERDEMPVSAITTYGFLKTNKARAIALTGIRLGEALNQKQITAARYSLWETEDYSEVDLKVQENPRSPGTVVVEILVTER